MGRSAQALEQAGCFGVVLECLPEAVAAAITAQLSVPTIGIGAGRHTSGQVRVHAAIPDPQVELPCDCAGVDNKTAVLLFVILAIKLLCGHCRCWCTMMCWA